MKKTGIIIAGLLMLCLTIGVLPALAESYPGLTLDKAEYTGSSYYIEATFADEYCGQGGCYNTFTLSREGTRIDSRDHLVNVFIGWDEEKEYATDTPTHRISFTFKPDYYVVCRTTAKFSLPSGTPAGVYTIKCKSETPDFYGGGLCYFTVSFRIGNDGRITMENAGSGPSWTDEQEEYVHLNLLYLIPDSDSRILTETELRRWDRESLTFIYNEIFARHGFTFDAGGEYYNHFNALPWYQAVPKRDDQTVYDMTTKIETDNYQLIKSVIEQKKAAGEPYSCRDGSLLSWRDIPWEYVNVSLTGFTYLSVPDGQKLDVYSAPFAGSWRGANGKAMLSTNGYIYAAGWENGWLLVFYELSNGNNAGGMRVGYVNGNQLRGANFSALLNFSRKQASVLQNCSLTDDPLRCYTTITTVPAGGYVTYLTTVFNQNRQAWDYVETTVNGQLVRGFIPAGNIEIPDEDG